MSRFGELNDKDKQRISNTIIGFIQDEIDSILSRRPPVGPNVVTDEIADDFVGILGSVEEDYNYTDYTVALQSWIDMEFRCDNSKTVDLDKETCFDIHVHLNSAFLSGKAEDTPKVIKNILEKNGLRVVPVERKMENES